MPTVIIPTLHPKQVEAFNLPGRFMVYRCGRRWGKTEMSVAIMCDRAMRGQLCGYFAPKYKFTSEIYREVQNILSPLIVDSNKTEGIIRLSTGGLIDFWTLQNNPSAGRSRKYHHVFIDEAAHGDDDLLDIWQKAIRPTLLDYVGDAMVFSTPNGIADENFFHRICMDKTLGFTEFHAPTHTNPYLPQEEVEKLKEENDPLVYQQEYLAEFVDWSGTAFFPIERFLVEGQPVPWPDKCDQIFATIDTALKDGSENDGTAVCFWARNTMTGIPMILLDWDIIQIQGSLLEEWLPSVNGLLEKYAKICGSRWGNIGSWIEDKGSGTILLQQAERRGIPAHPIDNKLVAVGKEGRALNVSGYVYRGEVKISQPALDKIVNYKGQSANHWLKQVCGFRMGQKDTGKRADDLLDSTTYSLSIGLGDIDGY